MDQSLHRGKRCRPHSSENCTSPPLHNSTPSFIRDPGKNKWDGKPSSHCFAIPGQQHRELPSALPLLKHGTRTHRKKQEEGGAGKKRAREQSCKIPSGAIPALKGAALLAFRASHSSSERLGPWRHIPAPAPAPSQGSSVQRFPYKGSHGRPLPALCPGSPQGKRAAAAAPALPGGLGGLSSSPGVGARRR